MRRYAALALLLGLLLAPAGGARELPLGSTDEGQPERPGLTTALPEEVQIPGHARYRLRYLEYREPTNSEQVWIGEVVDEPGSLAVFTTAEGHTAGTIATAEELIHVLPDGRIVAASAAEFDKLGCGTSPHPGMPSQTDAYRAPADVPPVKITLGLFYSQGVKRQLGDANAKALLRNALHFLNEGFARSGLGHITFKMVGLSAIGHDEAKPATHTPDYFTEKRFKGLRNNLRADLMFQALTDVWGNGGLANQYTGDPKLAYGSVRFEYLEWAFFHEVGHTIGMTHARGWIACPSGGTVAGVDFKTVDGIGPGGPPVPADCMPRLLVMFSNPHVRDDVTGLPLGRARTNDNSAVVAKNAPLVEKFRQ